MGYSFVYVILREARGTRQRPSVRRRSPGAIRSAAARRRQRRHRTERQQRRLDLPVHAGRQGTDARSARPAAAQREHGEAGAAGGRRRRRSGVDRRAREAVPGAAAAAADERARHRPAAQVITAFQGAFQRGGRPHDRSHQPRVPAPRHRSTRPISTSSNTWSSAATRPASRCTLRDVGYLQVGYDLRRGIADLDGEGEVVGGIAIMEQGRNVLVGDQRPAGRSSTSFGRTLPDGIDVVTTYNRSSLIWDTLTNFFQAIGYELIVVIIVIAVALKNLRAAVAPVAILLFGTLFTALPLSAVRADHQSVRAGRPVDRDRRDGRRDDRHRRELHIGARSQAQRDGRRSGWPRSSTPRRR